MTTVVRIGERLIIGMGVALLTIYGFFTLHAWFFQVYDSWSFDRSKEMSNTAVTHSVPGENVATGQGNVTEKYEGWAISRILSHEKALARPASSIVGRLLIPALDLNVMVLEGTDRWTLNRSVGHIENTALPGNTGNVGISGHRDGFFRNLGRIRPGDQIALVTIQKTYRYEVERTTIVKPNDTWVLADGGLPRLTLVTCYPFYYIGRAPERFVVSARLLND